MGRAIVRQPQVFLFDEPLSNLDAKLRGQTRLEIQKLHAELGITSLFVTHDQVEAMTLAQRMIVMNGGNVEQFGTPEEVYHTASTFVAGFIGSPPMNLLKHSPNGKPGLILGIRPEHIDLVEAGGWSSRCRPWNCWAPSACSTARWATRTSPCAWKKASPSQARRNGPHLGPRRPPALVQRRGKAQTRKEDLNCVRTRLLH
jgi:ABC-type dipeptide/oligopeptide/nickel transport system ATPase component